MTASNIQCEYPGCNATAATTTIHRTSPKGKGMSFRGRCEAHLGHTPDDDVLVVTDAIEFDNMRRQIEGR